MKKRFVSYPLILGVVNIFAIFAIFSLKHESGEVYLVPNTIPNFLRFYRFDMKHLWVPQYLLLNIINRSSGQKEMREKIPRAFKKLVPD